MPLLLINFFSKYIFYINFLKEFWQWEMRRKKWMNLIGQIETEELNCIFSLSTVCLENYTHKTKIGLLHFLKRKCFFSGLVLRPQEAKLAMLSYTFYLQGGVNFYKKTLEDWKLAIWKLWGGQSHFYLFVFLYVTSTLLDCKLSPFGKNISL